MKGFALGLALKQRRKATRTSPIDSPLCRPWKRSIKLLKEYTKELYTIPDQKRLLAVYTALMAPSHP